MDLAAGGPSNEAHAEQSVTTTDTGQEHVLRFRVLGIPGDSIKLRIGTTSTGKELVDDIAFETGCHTYAFTPDSSPFYIQFRNETNKTIGIDDVELFDDAPVEIASPFLESELAAIKFAQSADTMYLCHNAHPVKKLTRSSHTSWSLRDVLFNDGPYLAENPTGTTLTPSATGGTGITITASAVGGINDDQGFLQTDVGRLIRIKHGTNWGYAIVTARTSATVVVADVLTSFGATTAQSAWRLGAWSNSTGYPRAIAFYEQRLGFAATTDQPQTLWLSQSADFENMRVDSPQPSGDPAIEDDDALDYTISADQVNAIRWLSPRWR